MRHSTFAVEGELAQSMECRQSEEGYGIYRFASAAIGNVSQSITQASEIEEGNNYLQFSAQQ